MKKFWQKNNFLFLFLIVIAFFNLRHLLKPGLFRAHDIENHLARIANYYLAVKDGHFPPRWAKNLNHKFGYPVFNYNYPLANMLAYPLIVIGLSIEGSLKIILMSAYFSSGLFFYLWTRKHFSDLAAFTGAVFYLTAPYQFLDLFVRGVVGENLSFALFPAVLYCLKLLQEKSNWQRFLSLVFSLAFFALSHNIMVLVFTPLIFVYWFYLFQQSKTTKKFKKWSIKGLVLGFMLTSFFWLPALKEKQFVALQAFNIQDFYKDHFVYFKQLFDFNWQFGYSQPGLKDTLSFQVGPFHWLAVFLTLGLLLLKKLAKKRIFVLAGQGIFWLAVFLMLPISSFFWPFIPFLGYLQFPWRFLSLAILSASFLAVVLADKNKILAVVLAGLSLIYAQRLNKPFFWEKKNDMVYYDFLFTTSTRHENRPIWFNEENINNFRSRFNFKSGAVTIKELLWKTNEHIYQVEASEPTVVWEQTAYFPGWQAFIDGRRAPILFKEKDYPGVIGIQVPQGRHQVVTKFTQKTPIRIIGNSLTCLAFVLSLAMVKFLRKND